MYMNYRCYQIQLKVQHFYKNWERCEVLTGYLSLGAGLAVNGRIRDNGQNILKTSLQTESSKKPHLLPNFFPHCTEEAFVRNI